MPATGDNAVQITAEPEMVSHLSWSPNGRALCVTRSASGIGDLWILRLEGR